MGRLRHPTPPSRPSLPPKITTRHATPHHVTPGRGWGTERRPCGGLGSGTWAWGTQTGAWGMGTGLAQGTGIGTGHGGTATCSHTATTTGHASRAGQSKVQQGESEEGRVRGDQHCGCLLV
jgi:hypothetical protein